MSFPQEARVAWRRRTVAQSDPDSAANADVLSGFIGEVNCNIGPLHGDFTWSTQFLHKAKLGGNLDLIWC